MAFGLGIALGVFMGVPSGAFLFSLYCGVNVVRLRGELGVAVSKAWVEQTRARNLHRRAQKAEGRLQRIRHIMEEEGEE